MIGIGAAVSLWFGLVPLCLDLRPDVRIIFVTTALALLTGAFLAIAPAWNAARHNPTSAMQHGNRVIGRRDTSLSSILLFAQMALSVALLSAAVLFAHSLWELRSLQTGFDTEHLLTAMLMPRPGGHASADLSAYYRDLLRRIHELPGVAAASLSSLEPIDRTGAEFNDPVQTNPATLPIDANRHAVSPDFFPTLGMHIESGRAILDSDLATTPRVAVISASLAELLYPSGQAIGQEIIVGRKPNQVATRIVGVVSNANLQAIRHAKPYAVYLALYQEKHTWPTLEVRTFGHPEHLTDTVRRVIEARGRTVSLRIDSVASAIDDSFVQDRLLGYLAGFFALVALLLASIGLHGLLSFAVTHRTPELGIRIALGAKPATVTRMVLGEYARLVLSGSALGVLLAIPLTRALGSFLYHPRPTIHGPLAIAIAISVLLAVAMLACWIPARRAAATDPLAALRSE